MQKNESIKKAEETITKEYEKQLKNIIYGAGEKEVFFLTIDNGTSDTQFYFGKYKGKQVILKQTALKPSGPSSNPEPVSYDYLVTGFLSDDIVAWSEAIKGLSREFGDYGIETYVNNHDFDIIKNDQESIDRRSLMMLESMALRRQANKDDVRDKAEKFKQKYGKTHYE